MSSPVTVFLFSWAHLSHALWSSSRIVYTTKSHKHNTHSCTSPHQHKCIHKHHCACTHPYNWGYSLVMKLMYSETHSCIHSFASFETWNDTFEIHYYNSRHTPWLLTFPFLGRAFLIILAMLAMGRNRSYRHKHVKNKSNNSLDTHTCSLYTIFLAAGWLCVISTTG